MKESWKTKELMKKLKKLPKETQAWMTNCPPDAEMR